MDTVTTAGRVHASPTRVFDALVFYEQIAEPPPAYLRWLLPAPVRTEGHKRHVGDEAKCIYASGYLVKKVTGVRQGELLAFDVISQELSIGNGVRLSGGEYRLRELQDGSTELTLVTRYTSPRAPRFFWRWVEKLLCHAFHRHLLRVTRRLAESDAELVRA